MAHDSTPFRSFLADVSPIVMKEPLAEFLGGFDGRDALVEYAFADVVKMAGHACPTVASAFVCCKKALDRLHAGEVPVRGNIAVTVHAEPDDRTYGVMGQVFGFVTGAAGETGFKGLGHKFRRKGLLTFDPAGADGESMSFTFARLDTGQQVRARVVSDGFPAVPGQDAMSELMEKAFWEAATPEEEQRFRDLWMERVKAIALDERDVDSWLVIEPV